jgi:tRNA A37 methylthiotransferase MiaB
MGLDVLLLSLPNKNIDYPALSLPVLTAALRQAGMSVEQEDVNIVFRNAILSKDGLSGILDDSIPFYSQAFCKSGSDVKRLLAIADFLDYLRHEYGFEELVGVKSRAQAREYEWIFGNDLRFRQFLYLFKVNRALHYLIDIAVTCSYEQSNDYLTDVVKKNLDEILAKICAVRPSVVGISILDIQRHYSLRLIRHIRDKYDGKIIIGGADPTRFANEYIHNCPDVDAVFCREADVSLPHYIEALASINGSLDKVSGIMYRNSEGKIIVNRHKPVDLSITPSPDFRGLPLELYLTPAMPIQASRGCYWQQCRFCIHWDTYCDFRMRAPAKVLEDMNALAHQHKTKYFHFTDDCLPIQKIDEFREMLKLIRDSHLEPRWLGYFRFEKELDRALLKEVYGAGGRVLEIGLESASNRVLKLMRKNISVDIAAQIVEDASDLGFLVKVFMFHGFPGEGIDDAMATVDFAEKYIYGKKIRPFLPLRNRFELLRGSDIYRSVKAGLEKDIVGFWEPSGLFGLRAEYELNCAESDVQEVIRRFVDKARAYMSNNKIYSTDDENVILDLLVLDKVPLKSGWRCI